MDNRHIDRSSPIPAYYQIARDLKQRIAGREWAVNAKLPSEFELAEYYSVSRITLRQALAELVKDGVVNKHRGRGIFVSANPVPFVHDLSYPFVLAERLRQQGLDMKSEVVALKLIEELTSEVKQQLQLQDGASVVYIMRLFVLNGNPIAINQSWLPRDLVPGLETEGLIESRLSKTLSERFGLIASSIDNSLEIVHATQAEAKLLKTTHDAPLLLLRGTSCLTDGRPLEFSLTSWLGDSIRFHFKTDSTPDGYIIRHS